ncbi:MAG: hypothetical protein Q7J31_12355 [Syntrophales bacterium]|nr:hypothetical protein [Syntrophales bacterium]
MKRIFDFTALFLFGLPMLLAALLVKLTSLGPDATAETDQCPIKCQQDPQKILNTGGHVDGKRVHLKANNNH